MANIYLLWASIRELVVKDVAQHWINTCVNKDRLFFKIGMATEEQKQIVESYNIPNCEVTAITDKRGYCHAATKLAKQLEVNDNDIVIFLTDDFYSPQNWDEYLYSKFTKWDGALFLNDGCNDRSTIITIGCMTFKCLKRLNRYAFHPSYNQFYSDDECYLNLKELGLLKDDRISEPVIFQHQHYGIDGTRPDTHDQNAMKLYELDGENWNIRKRMFISDRLK